MWQNYTYSELTDEDVDSNKKISKVELVRKTNSIDKLRYLFKTLRVYIYIYIRLEGVHGVMKFIELLDPSLDRNVT